MVLPRVRTHRLLGRLHPHRRLLLHQHRANHALAALPRVAPGRPRRPEHPGGIHRQLHGGGERVQRLRHGPRRGRPAERHGTRQVPRLHRSRIPGRAPGRTPLLARREERGVRGAVPVRRFLLRSQVANPGRHPAEGPEGVRQRQLRAMQPRGQVPRRASVPNKRRFTLRGVGAAADVRDDGSRRIQSVVAVIQSGGTRADGVRRDVGEHAGASVQRMDPTERSGAHGGSKRR